MSILLTVENVSKSFSKKKIFKDVSFIFKNGCYSIVGPNGVGKTILLDMLAGVMKQDVGSISLADVGESTTIEYKKKLVYIPGKPAFFPSTTGMEFLNFILATKKCSYKESGIENLISKFQLTNHLNTCFADMSLGTQKKLFLMTLLIGNNSILILDEPSNGLDYESNEVLCDLLLSLSTSAIIILATHDPLLIKKLNPTIVELKQSPTSILEINNNFKVQEDERILQLNQYI